MSKNIEILHHDKWRNKGHKHEGDHPAKKHISLENISVGYGLVQD
jgi:hypothetical protein